MCLRPRLQLKLKLQVKVCSSTSESRAPIAKSGVGRLEVEVLRAWLSI